MKPYKATGPAGYQSYFYQSQWYIDGSDVCSFIRTIFEGKTNMADINKSFFVLIPKVPKLKYLNQFWPLGICNVNFKIVTNILVNQLKSLMPNLVSVKQSSFVPGRNITDNIVMAQEIIHSMRNMRGTQGYMAIKVDLEKAYDKLRWDFIRDTLMDAGLPSQFVDLVMKCIETTSSLRVSEYYGMIILLRVLLL